MTVRSVSYALKLQVADFIANGGKALGVPKAIGKEFDDLGKRSKTQFHGIADAAGAAGLALTGAFALINRTTMGFDKEMSEVGAVANASSKDLDRLRGAAISAGQATVYSAKDAADAEADLEKAGVSTANVLGGALTGSLSLAAAGTISLDDAATDAAEAMNIFQLGGAQVGHIADVLAAGANKSAADVKSLTDGLKQGGQVAAMTGLNLEDTVGTLAAFADNALQGSDAGTSLKTMLQALQAPSGVTAKLMAQLGISAYDSAGQFIGITKFAGQLQRQLGGLTEQERAHAFAQIFGADATRAANVLYKLGASGLQDYITKVNDLGAADEMARAKMNNLSGDVENLKGSIETLTIATGEGGQSGLRGLTQAATRAVNSFGVMPGAVSKVGVEITGLAGVTLLGGAALLKLRQKSDEVQESLASMGTWGGRAATGLGRFTSFATKLTAILAVLQTTSAAFGTTINPVTSEVAKHLEELGASGKATGTELKHLSYDIGTVGSGGWTKFGNGVAGTVESLTGLGSVFDESLTHAQQRIASIDQGLTALVGDNKIAEAQAAFQQLADIAQDQGISISDLKNALPNYTAALDNLGTAETGAAAGAQDQTDATDALASSIEDAKNQANGLIGLLDQLNGTNLDSMKTEDDLYAAFDAATKAIKENGKTAIAHGRILDVTTEKGRANRQVIEDLVAKTNAHAQAVLDNTHNQKLAADVLAQGRDELYKDLLAMGLNKDAAQAYVDTLLKIPPTNTTTFEAPGLVTVNDVASGYKRLMDGMDGRRVTVKWLTKYEQNGTPPSQYWHGNRWGGAFEHAAVGTLREASTYSATSPGRYMIAEPGTGGEAFIPRHGDPRRSLGILNRAAGWYGMAVGRPGGGGGGGPIQIVIQLAPQPGAAASLVQQLRAEIKHIGGGDVQVALGS